MCGIIGYIGKNNCLPVLISGLKSLEYRGYDSSGIAILSKKDKIVKVKKTIGGASELKRKIKKNELNGCLGIGHARWATHGVPNEINAHPHTGKNKRIFVVHNGIIENYNELKKYLESKKYKFISKTDTEVIPQLIEHFLDQKNDFNQALINTLKMIKGAYALAIIDSKNPKKIYGAKFSSPLVIGIGKNENFIASDATALIGKTKKIIYIKDGEIAEISKTKINITNFEKQKTNSKIVNLEGNLEQVKKGKYDHFMLKEIFETPLVVNSTIRGRINSKNNTIKLGGLEENYEKLKDTKRIIILACGTSYYAGLIAEYLFEEIAKIPTEVQLASEFNYRSEIFPKNTIVLAISQSGETADTLAAIKKAKKQGLFTLGLVNNIGSSISRETDAGVYNHAGPEISVASTKAFISQVTALILITIYFSKNNGNINKNIKNIIKELNKIPRKIKIILNNSKKIEKLSEKYINYNNFLFLGRRYDYPVALEGALKLKEISYIHAEGYSAGEMKHGPIAMISKDFPTMALITNKTISDKMISNLEEIKTRGGQIIAISTRDNKKILLVTKDVFFIPKTIEPLQPILAIVPLQLFAYYIGTKKGFNVDKPRNLAKSVTVE